MIDDEFPADHPSTYFDWGAPGGPARRPQALRISTLETWRREHPELHIDSNGRATPRDRRVPLAVHAGDRLQ